MTATATGTPIVIARYLTNRGTDKRRGKARIVQVFVPEQGWRDLRLINGEPYEAMVTTRTIEVLTRRMGATSIAVEYTPPAWMTRQPGQRVRADFTTKECLS